MMNRSGWKYLAIAAVLLSVLLQASCKKKMMTVFPPLPSEEIRAGGGLALSAHLLSDTAEIGEIFNSALPDSGIVPFHVTVRNNDICPVRIHSANALGLDGNFDGFVLETGKEPFVPVHPLEALWWMKDSGRKIRYRGPGAMGIFAGTTVVPPLGVYYIYREISVGRHYKPLFEQSLHPALDSGLMKPVTLEPGEERSGYLYFHLPPDLNPYSGAGGAAAPPGTLRVRASFSIAAADSIPFDVFLTGRDDGRSGAPGSGRRSADLLVALTRSGPSGNGAVTLVSMEALARGLDRLPGAVTGLSSKNASIADVSVSGKKAACAVNFTTKSRIFLFGLGDDPELLVSKRFPRKIDRVFLTDEGLIVVAGGKHCHLLGLDDLEPLRRARFGYDADDVMLHGGRLYVFHRKRGVHVYGGSGEGILRDLDRRSLPEASRRVVAVHDDGLVLLHRSKRTPSDTLFRFSTETMEETGGMALPGRAVLTAPAGEELLVQLADGTVLLIGTGASGEYRIVDAYYVAFTAAAIHSTPPYMAALGEGGLFVRGFLEDFRPGALDVIRAAAGVTFAPRPEGPPRE